MADADAGKALAGFVRERLSLPWSRARQLVGTGKVFIDGSRCTDAGQRLRAGQEVGLHMSAPRPQTRGARVRIAYEDAHVVVIDKPVDVSSVPYERRETGTAMDLLREAWRKLRPDAGRTPLHVVHRIDKATSGLLAFAKTKRAELGLAAQFRQHTLERAYLCVAHGAVRAQRIESRLVRDRGDGLRGSTRAPNQGKRAVTHVEVLEELARASLCQVRLETGKTHQIRIHLAERGHPLVGERVYKRDAEFRGHTLIDAPRLMLHAATLGFAHPITGERVFVESPLPENFAAVLARLRAESGQRGG
ncbi:pseudouridine synthase, RluA family [Haliangium ochraceum DSM 14365]|uniref:Pseudouridine synthase n=1 Tax=Haliangium ochraceum (strain DSM 14365 / JCM 11303 / SMP-2) TaxID=502025 RepID=D0LGK2_HALO1|nr:pseudouridine synthase, RluA family [Haliangium ochraceum DSM 14365]